MLKFLHCLWCFFLFFELPILHAINKHYPDIVQLLINNHSKLGTKGKPGLLFATSINEIECARILYANDADPLETDPQGRNAFDFACELDDPSIELMLASPEKVSTTIGIPFIYEINKQLQQQVDQLISELSTKSFKNKSAYSKYISLLSQVHRRLQRFDILIEMRIHEFHEEIESITDQPENNQLMESESAIKSIIRMWSEKLTETKELQKKCSEQAIIHQTDLTIQKWEQITKSRKAFIESLFDRSINESLELKSMKARRAQLEQDIAQIHEFSKFKETRTPDFEQQIIKFINTAEKKGVIDSSDSNLTQIINELRQCIDITQEEAPVEQVGRKKSPRKAKKSRE